MGVVVRARVRVMGVEGVPVRAGRALEVVSRQRTHGTPNLHNGDPLRQRGH